MTHRILIRSPRDPFEVVDPETALLDNLVWDNSGNLIFLGAAQRLLSTRDAVLTPDRGRPARLGVDRINERFDVFVLPLANAFRLSYRRQLARLTDLIRGLRIPVVVLGVGAQGTVRMDATRLAPIEREVRAFVSAVLDRGPSIGVRGAFTADYLRSLGFRDVDVIGCPSMFLHGPRLPLRETPAILDPDAPTALNLSPYLAEVDGLFDRHVRRFRDTTYIAQDLVSLERLLWGEEDRRTRMYVDPWPWLADLARFEFAFGTRIHGNIAALLAGTPAYLLAHDSRTLELAEYFEIPHAILPDLRPDEDAASLRASADYGPLVRGHAARFDAFAAYLGRHGLHHVFEDGEDPTAFERRIAETPFAPAVVPGAGRKPGPASRWLWRTRRRISRGVAVAGMPPRSIRSAST